MQRIMTAMTLNCIEIRGIAACVVMRVAAMPPGSRLNIKMSSYQYRDSHAKDKTVSPTVLYLTWKSLYLRETVFTLRRGPERDSEVGATQVESAAKEALVRPTGSLSAVSRIGRVARIIWTFN